MKATSLTQIIIDQYLECTSISDLQDRLAKVHVQASLDECRDIHKMLLPLKDSLINLENYISTSLTPS